MSAACGGEVLLEETEDTYESRRTRPTLLASATRRTRVHSSQTLGPGPQRRCGPGPEEERASDLRPSLYL